MGGTGRAMRVRAGLALALAGCLLAGCAGRAGAPRAAEPAPPDGDAGPLARGVVFHDRDRDGARGLLEEGLAGVAVSNGRDVVRTDARGRYVLPAPDDSVLFVVKPRGFAPPTGPLHVPRFHYVHKPAGSPPLFFAGVAPTGPLPDAVDFPLHRVEESERFRVLVLGDSQPATLEEVDLLSRDVIAPLVGVEAAFALVLGDVVGDDLGLFVPVGRALGALGIPWYPVHGNHDMNYDAADDAHADETWERVFGPASYAFQVGRAHFLVLDDVHYRGWDAEAGHPGGYDARLGDDQLDFVRGYLAGVPSDDLVVVAVHIPLHPTPRFPEAQRRALLEILSRHPRTLSLSGHTHFQEQVVFGPEDGYAPGGHLHWNQGAAAGSWWRGAPDETGIPHTTMRCGAPNGYAFLDVDGADYSFTLRAARRPADHQMHVVAPDAVPAAEAAGTEVLVNVFAGSPRSEVTLRVVGAAGAGPRVPLERVERPDPLYVATFERERAAPERSRGPLPRPIDSPHLWRGVLPEGLAPGTHTLEVRAVDPAGLDARAHRLVRVLP